MIIKITAQKELAELTEVARVWHGMKKGIHMNLLLLITIILCLLIVVVTNKFLGKLNEIGTVLSAIIALVAGLGVRIGTKKVKIIPPKAGVASSLVVAVSTFISLWVYWSSLVNQFSELIQFYLFHVPLILIGACSFLLYLMSRRS